MRVTSSEITLPPFPRGLRWIGTAALRTDQQRGRPVLVEFWDFCRINSLRTLPYVKAWHTRYAELGLRVIGVHTGGFACSREPDAIEAAVARLGVEHPVVVDSQLEVWDFYGNAGWPARYLWHPEQTLYSMHYGEGAYAETEREIGELLGVDVEPLDPLRPEDVPGLELPAQTADQPGAYEGPYEAGGVHLVCTGSGEVRVGGSAARRVPVDGCGCYTVLEHGRHTVGELELRPGAGVQVLATCFTPAPAA
ncbi:MAG: redoxin domain-containing protein [Solirubrobacteraceae bacterium]